MGARWWGRSCGFALVGYEAQVTRRSTKRRRSSNPRPGRNSLRATSGNVVAAVRLSKLFHSLNPREIVELDVTWPKALVSLGLSTRLDYLSDKFDGEPRVYFHEFDRPPMLFTAAALQPNGDSILILIGKFKIEKAGIVG